MAKQEATATAAAKAPKFEPFSVTLTKDKETKNALRFQEDTVEGQAPRIGTLYVQKHAVPTGTERIVVTVELE